MKYKKIEKEIIEATKDFAESNKVHYDELTESMILNAMRELNTYFIADVKDFSKRLDKIFEDSNPTKALIIDAYIKTTEQLSIDDVVVPKGKCCLKPKKIGKVNDMFESWDECKNCGKEVL